MERCALKIQSYDLRKFGIFFQQIDFKILPINYPLNTVIEEVNQRLMKHLLIVNLPSMYSTPNLTVCDNEGGVCIWSYLVKGLVFK